MKRLRWALGIGALYLILFLMTGCSTGGGGGSRGRSLSNATAQAGEESKSGRENQPGRDGGRSRTKTDHQSGERQQDSRADHYEEDEEDGFLSNLIFDVVGSLFSSNDDGSVQESVPPPAAPPRSYPDYDYNGMEVGGPRKSADSSSDHEERQPVHIQVWVSGAILGGDAMESVSTLSVVYSHIGRGRWGGYLGGYYGQGRKGSQAMVRDGIDKFREFGLDVGMRGHLTPADARVGAHLLFGTRVGSLGWSYRQFISVPDGQEVASISGDNLFLFTPYLGLGVTLVKAGSLSLGGDLTWGVRLPSRETMEGFDNDLLPAVGELRLNLVVTLAF